MSEPHHNVAVAQLVQRRQLTGTEAFCHYYKIANYPGVSAIWVGRHEPTEADPYHHVTLEQTYFFCGQEFQQLDDALTSWRDQRDQNLIRERVAESLLRITHGLVRPLWCDRSAEQRASWLYTADIFIRNLKSFGIQIDLGDRTDGR